MINFIKKVFMLFLTIGFPWLVFLIDDNPGSAILALILQITLIGWPFAIIWAWRAHYSSKKEET